MATIIDLHCHTTISDGAFSPIEIIDMAIKNNIKHFSITDHDNIGAYTKDVLKYAKDNNIDLIKGVEISTKFNKQTIHILGYNIDLNNKSLNDTLKKIRNARHEYLHNVSKKLNDLAYIVNTDELDKIESVTKAHIANDVINNPNNKKVLLENFNKIPNMGEFIENVMNVGCPAYVKKVALSPKEASALIKEANGKVIIAHPVAYTYEQELSDDDLIKLAKDIKADGIESNYIYIDNENKLHNDINKWNKLAKENNLITTIGSDFHTFESMRPELGFNNYDFSLTKEEVLKIIENLNK